MRFPLANVGFLCWVVMMSAAMAAESDKPVIGYDKLAWGVSAEEVVKEYPGTREVNESGAVGLTDGEKRYMQFNPGNGIRCRVFQFYDGGLYSVGVFYEELDSNGFKALADKMSANFGRSTRTEEEEGTANFTHTFEYHRELVIKMQVKPKRTTGAVMIMYMNPVVRAVIDKRIVDQRKGEIGL